MSQNTNDKRPQRVKPLTIVTQCRNEIALLKSMNEQLKKRNKDLCRKLKQQNSRYTIKPMTEPDPNVNSITDLYEHQRIGDYNIYGVGNRIFIIFDGNIKLCNFAAVLDGKLYEITQVDESATEPERPIEESNRDSPIAVGRKRYYYTVDSNGEEFYDGYSSLDMSDSEPAGVNPLRKSFKK